MFAWPFKGDRDEVRSKTIVLLMFICISGCGTMIERPVSIGEDTFSVTARGDSPLSDVPGSVVKANAVRMAKHHCAKMGMDYQQIAVTETAGFRPTTEVQFKCIPRTG